MRNEPAADAAAAARAAHVQRLNRALAHVARHLAGPLALADVAREAGLSPCHFHRVFKAAVGETLHQYVTRQRLERALYLMSHAPRQTLTEVALACGFASSSDFSRSFRQRHGVPPSRFDLVAFRRSRRDAFDQLLARQLAPARLAALPVAGNPDGFEVRLRELPARTVAYLRVPQPFRPGAAQAACERLLAWAAPRGLAGGQWLGYLWDEPEVVALADCRYDVAVVVDGDFAPAGEVGRLRFAPMRVAEVVVRGDLALQTRAFDWLYGGWLPRSGFVPDDLPAFEAWLGRPFAHGTAHFELACQLPVRRG